MTAGRQGVQHTALCLRNEHAKDALCVLSLPYAFVCYMRLYAYSTLHTSTQSQGSMPSVIPPSLLAKPGVHQLGYTDGREAPQGFLLLLLAFCGDSGALICVLMLV